MWNEDEWKKNANDNEKENVIGFSHVFLAPISADELFVFRDIEATMTSQPSCIDDNDDE